MDVIYSGWLTKSPPESKMKGIGPFKSQWRKRYFVLYGPPKMAAASKFVSGTHACLHYYENEDQVKKKGSIDLKNCLEVRDRLESTFYRHLFSLHTNGRTYYLAAESELEMNSWVDHLIQSLGLNVGGSDLQSPLPVMPTLPANGSSGPFLANKSSHVGGSVSFSSPGDLSRTKPVRTCKQTVERNLSAPGLPNSGALRAPIDILDTVVECSIRKENCDRSSAEVKVNCDRRLNTSHYQSPKPGLHVVESDDDEGNYDLPPRGLRSIHCEDVETDDIYNTPSSQGQGRGHPLRAEGSDDDDVYDTPRHGSDKLHGHTGDHVVTSSAHGDGSAEDVYDIPPSDGQQFNGVEGSLDDVYDTPPPKAHERKAAKVHSYVNAPYVVPFNRLLDQVASKFEGVVSSSAESLSSDESDERNSPSSDVCYVSMTTRTRSFRKGHVSGPARSSLDVHQ